MVQGKSLRSKLSWERAHPFTTFCNHDTKDKSWDIGIVMTVMEDKFQWLPAWTRKTCNYDDSGELPLIKEALTLNHFQFPRLSDRKFSLKKVYITLMDSN